MNDVLLKEQQVCIDSADVFRPTHHFGWGGTIWHHFTASGTGTVMKHICFIRQQARHLGVNLHLGKKVRPNTP